jgi:hypothetical protein
LSLEHIVVSTPEGRLQTQAIAIGALNQVEYLLRVLGEDQDVITKLTSPLYELLDKD